MGWLLTGLLLFGQSWKWEPAPEPTTPTATTENHGKQTVLGAKKSDSSAGLLIEDLLSSDGVSLAAKAAQDVIDDASDHIPEIDFSKVIKNSGPPPVCTWQPVDPATESHEIPIPYDLSKGRVEKKVCGAPAGDTSGLGSAVVDWAFVENGAPPPGEAAPPVVDVQALARRAYEELQVPAPRIGVGPDRSTVAVQLPTWLWVDDPGPLTAVASTGGVTVTANATLTSTRWSLGEPDRNPAFTGYRAGPPVTMTCAGAGTPPPVAVSWKTEPVCGHTFRWRSLPERTDGAGAWPVSATTTWDVTWTATTGQSGQIQLTATGTDDLPVTEYRILLTDGS